MGVYLLKFSACLLVFWLIYMFLLERQKMHHFKRFYLLGAFALSLLIPQLTITEYLEPIIADIETTSIFIPMETTSMEEIPIEETSLINLETVLWLFYGLGVFIFLFRFVINLVRLYRLISKNENVTKYNFIYVLLKEYRIPHSFFNYIFLNKLKFENNEIPKEVLLHEETHAKQLHSLDIIIIELLQIVFWFHPLIYILKHHIKLNHEFLADQAVIEKGTDTSSYQKILLQFSSNTQNQQLASAINYSSIKKRFTVMKTQTSKTRIWISSLLLLPIIAILFYSFAEKEYLEKENIAETSEFNETNSESNLFLVTVEKNGNSIELRCESGCKWSHLILEPRSESYIINDYGFSEGNTIETDKFAFSIQPNSFGVDLDGIKGTAWLDLNFSLKENQIQAINQLGMTSKLPKAAKKSFKGKTLDIKVINNQLKVNDVEYDINNYADALNSYTKNWTLNDYKSSTMSKLEISGCSQDFLDKLDTEFRKSNYFLLTIQGIKPNQEWNNVKTILDQEKPILWILINRKNQFLVGDEITTLESIDSKLKQLTKQGKAGQLVAIKYDTETSKSIISKVVALVNTNKFKVASFDISEIPPPPLSKKTKGVTNLEDTRKIYNPSFLEYIIEMDKEGALFYLDGKKITAQKATSIAKTNKGKSTEMLTQKDANGKYVVKLSSPKSIENQQKATDKQIATYNKLAKHYNKILKDTHHRILLKDVEKLKYLYGLMSDEQRKNSEPFPNFPKPPPPPPSPEEPILIEEQEVIPPPPPPIPENADPEEVKRLKKVKEDYKKKYSENYKKDETNRELIEIVEVPPPPPAPESTLDFVIRMAKANAKFFYKLKPVSSDKAIALLKKNPKLHINAQKVDSEEPLIYISTKPIHIGEKGKSQN